PPGPGQRAFPSTATCAPYTPRGSASTPLAVSPCTTIPVTALSGSTTGTTPPPKVPTPRGRCCTTSASTMAPVATCRARRSPYASTDIPSPRPVTLRSAPAPGPSRPTHCYPPITSAIPLLRSPGSTPPASSTTGYRTCISRHQSAIDQWVGSREHRFRARLDGATPQPV